MATKKTTKEQTIIYKALHRKVKNPTKNQGELGYSGMVGSSCSTCGTCRVILVINPGIRHEWGKNRMVITTNGTYPWSFVTQILRNG